MTRTFHHNPKYENQGKGEFNLAYQLEMIADRERVSLFKRGIDCTVDEDTVFCELGCGTGIFALHAAKKAKRVYAVEHDENIIKILKQNIKQSAYADKITIIEDDLFSVRLPEKVDIAFCEMLSMWLIEEPEVSTMNYARRNLLKPEGITIPRKVINLAELCNVDYVFDGVEMRTSIVQFTGIKRPRVMTESKVFNSFSFDRENPGEITDTLEFTVLTSGVISSVRLSSIVNIHEGINFYSTDSLMPLTIVPLKNDVFVEEGQKVWLTGHYEHRGGLNNAIFELEK